ncbi:hypothetical protein [Larkinella soli]|uniref:hypothetical protein n=1 Tax=Larkinella soli TaxID=1770527 RepID=UPI000FFB9591|nr:hypothetical protein [Larkinella soli]
MNRLTLLLFTIALAFWNCRKQKSTGLTARADTVAVLQTLLSSRHVDSLVNDKFAFKGQSLKILRNGVIHSDYVLHMNRQPVQYTAIDTSSAAQPIWNKPKFELEIGRYENLPNNEVRVSLQFNSVGVLCDSKVKK